MARKTDLIRKAEAEIVRLEINIKRLEEHAFKQRAEVKAYKNMIEWSKNAGAKSSTNK